MKGSSGASLHFCGDFILKECADAQSQYDWFCRAGSLPMVDGMRLPAVHSVSTQAYRIEFIHGTCATACCSTRMLDAICDQIDIWRGYPSQSGSTWNAYIDRLRAHAEQSQSEAMTSAVSFIASQPAFPPSFGHGDLTLENVIASQSGEIVLIDPNNKPDVYQSWVLDYGKLLQSLHADYHRVFQSNAGCDPLPLLAHLRSRLGVRLFQQAIIAELSHLVRLRKYRPAEQRPIVDAVIQRIMADSWS